MRTTLPSTVLILAGLFTMLSGCSQDGEKSATTPKRKPQVHLVNTITVVPQKIAVSYQRTGTLKHRKLAHIYTQEAGQIMQLPWFEGDNVAQGQVLVKLDGTLLEAEQDKAKANTRQAIQDLSRIKELQVKRAASKDELLKAKTALDIARAEQKILDTRVGYMEITAPFAGVVTERQAEPGDVIPRHTHIMTLADPESLITQVSVSELLLPDLAPGDEVSIRIDALGQQNYQGHILRIHPELDAGSRQGKVEIKLNPVPEKARAGQFVRVTLHAQNAQRLLIPFTALRRDRKSEYVYLLQQGKAVRSDVHTGVNIGDQIELLDGIKAGQKIISKGFMGLSDGKSVSTPQK